MWRVEESALPPAPPRIIRVIRSSHTVDVPRPVVVCDTREREGCGWQFCRYAKWFAGRERWALPLGDYSLAGYETRIAVERKSLADAIQSTAPSQNRARFIHNVACLAEYARAAIVIEASYMDLHYPHSQTRMHPNAVLGSYLALQARFNVPVIFAGNAALAEEWTAHFLTKAYVHLWLLDHGYGGQFVDGDI